MKNKDNPVWYWPDGMPRYHPDFRYIGKRWVTVDGKRVMVDENQ